METLNDQAESFRQTLFLERKFPTITHLDDVLPHIKEKTEFVIRRRDWYTSIDYKINLPKTFPMPHEDENWAILRECRGLIFDEQGYLISRPYHKFRNYLETRESAGLTPSDLLGAKWLEKHDGSMVRPVLNPGLKGGYTWMTRAGETEVSQQVVVFENSQWRDKETRGYAMDLHDFNWTLLCSGKTPIYEWCSRQNKVVLDHPEDRLLLTAVRDNLTGRYLGQDELPCFSDLCPRLLRPYAVFEVKDPPAASHFRDLEAMVRAERGKEGVVLRFASGEMLKIKADDYCRLHRLKGQMDREKDVIQLLLEDKLDDLLPIVFPSERERLLRFQEAFWSGFRQTEAELTKYCMIAQPFSQDQRSYAVDFVNKQPKHWSHVLFELRKEVLKPGFCGHGLDTTAFLLRFINTSTQAHVDGCRWIFNAYWNPQKEVTE